MHSMRETRSDRAAAGIRRMSSLETPSGPMAANLRLEATTLVSASVEMGGNSTDLGGMACFINPTMASHCSGFSCSGLCHRGPHSSSKA